MALNNAHGATCRWCAYIATDREGMQRHHKNDYCKERLLAVYKFAKLGQQQRYCFACKKPTLHFRWGFPLCNTVSCLARWKFCNRDGWHGFMQYYQWALDAELQAPKDGPFSNIPEGPIRPEHSEATRDGH